MYKIQKPIQASLICKSKKILSYHACDAILFLAFLFNFFVWDY